MIDKGFSPEKFIDREAEQELFEELLHKFQDDSRLLTICDAGGRGKSSLLKRLEYNCLWQHDPPTPVSLIPLDQLDDPTDFALVRSIRRKLGESVEDFGLELPFTSFDQLDDARVNRDPEPFRTRTGSIQGMAYAQGATIRGGTVGGVVQQVEHAEHVTVGSFGGWSTEHDDMARRECIKAFFEDLKHICRVQPVVVLLDTWENSLADREFILNRIVRPLCFDTKNRPEKFYLVLAGREVPDFRIRLNEAKYRKLVKSIESLGEWEERHVKDFLRAYGYENLKDEDIGYLCSKLRSGTLSLEKALQMVAEFLWAG
jgi:hypothetical protein